MFFRSALISTSLIALLTACGGGGGDIDEPKPPVVDTDNDGVADDKDAFPTISGTDLDSFTQTVVLQSLALDTTNNQVGVSEAAKSTTSAKWEDASTDYVVKYETDIVGIAMESIPASVEFAATGTASMYIVNGTTQYGLQKGDVSGSISSDATKLTVNLSWAGDEISAPQNEEQNASAPTAMTMTLMSSQTGATDCGGANILCGGTVSVTSNEASMIDTTNLSANQYKAGIYGSTAENAELGGQINYVEQDTLTIVGSFVGDTK